MEAAYRLEKQSANDISATITEVLIPSGEEVVEGAHIVDVETSKATQEVYAHRAGRLRHNLEVGMDVAFGEILFTIGEAAAAKPVEAAPQAEQRGNVTVTAKAAAKAALLGIDPTDLGYDFVTVHHLTAKEPASTPSSSAMTPIEMIEEDRGAVAAKRLPSLKRAEINILTGGAGNSALSVIGTNLGRIVRLKGNHGYYENNGRHSGKAGKLPQQHGFFDDNILDLVAYEASRLMLSYPKLNASFVAPDSYREHPTVNVGIAVDEGARLVVYSIGDSHRKSLVEIQNEIVDGLAKYVENRLTEQDMQATFTITDLSSYETSFILPLLPKGQSCIIGIAGQKGEYLLYAGFDHRVSEGREVAMFLKELRSRLVNYAAAQQQECHFCGKHMEVELEQGGKGFVKVMDRHGQDVPCCHGCWTGL